MGGGKNPYSGDVATQAGNLSRVGSQYNNAGQQSYDDYNYYRPQAQDATSQLAQLLQRRSGGATSQERAGYINGRLGNVQDAYNQQMEMLKNQSAGGGGNSWNQGQGTVYAAQLAKALGSAGNDASNYYDQRQADSLNQLQQLLSGQAQQNFGNAMGAYGGAQSAYGNAANQYGNLAQAWQAQQDAQQQQLMGLLGGGLQLAGNLYGMGAFGGIPAQRQQTQSKPL